MTTKLRKRIHHKPGGETIDEWEFEVEPHELKELLRTLRFEFSTGSVGITSGKGGHRVLSPGNRGWSDHPSKLPQFPTVEEVTGFISSSPAFTHSLESVSEKFFNYRLHSTKDYHAFHRLQSRIALAKKTISAKHPGMTWTRVPKYIDGRRTWEYHLAKQ
jgi:hypothetical protein